MTDSAPAIVCFGEVLWDVFPDKSLLGGAPLNVAMRLHSLGVKSHIISSVGGDSLGDQVISQLASHDFPTATLAKHESLPTGQVSVSLKDGIPSYTIESPVAWDDIEANQQALEAVRNAQALVFGSLAMRSSPNFDQLKTLIHNDLDLIFDINLREPFYTDTSIMELVALADIIKLNDEELEYMRHLYNIDGTDIDDILSQLSETTKTPIICVTLGSNGAILFKENKAYHHPGYPVTVADTVGAGDSFLAGLIFGLYAKHDPQSCLDLACALGALVASKSGAICTVTQEEIKAIQA